MLFATSDITVVGERIVHAKRAASMSEKKRQAAARFRQNALDTSTFHPVSAVMQTLSELIARLWAEVKGEG